MTIETPLKRIIRYTLRTLVPPDAVLGSTDARIQQEEEASVYCGSDSLVNRNLSPAP